MPGNDFEKQVQQKMEELNFTPSEAVWAAVEKQVGKKKDRRRLLLILLPLVMLLGGAVWFFGSDKKQVSGEINNTIANTQSSPMKHPNDKTGNQQNGTGNTEPVTPGKNGKIKTEVQDIAAEKDDKATIYSDKTNSDKSIVDNRKEVYSNKGNNEKNVIDGKNKVIPPVSKNVVTQIKKNSIVENNVGFSPEGKFKKPNSRSIKAQSLHKKVTLNDTELVSIRSNDNHKNKNSTLKGVNITVSRNPGNKEAINIVASLLESNKNQVESFDSLIVKAIGGKNVDVFIHKKRTTEFGILASAGVSNNSSKGFSSLLQSANDATYALASSNGPGNVSYAKASPLKGGLAFNIGVGAKKELSNRFSVVSGLTYSYFSNSLQVGDFYDSSRSVVQSGNQDKRVENFYSASTTAGGATHQYTNRYHYISLPIGLEMKLGSRSHFVAEGGMVISRFIASNALHFDPSGFYYKDNSLFNKTQLAFYGGIDYTFLLNKKTKLVIGPRLQYGASNTYKKSMYGSNHSLFAGIGANIFFNKK